MLGRATIRLGIGPHSSFLCSDVRLSHLNKSLLTYLLIGVGAEKEGK